MRRWRRRKDRIDLGIWTNFGWELFSRGEEGMEGKSRKGGWKKGRDSRKGREDEEDFFIEASKWNNDGD